MAKLDLRKLADLEDKASTANNINLNSEDIEDAIDNTLSRDGSVPNHMMADIDMDNHNLMNIDQVDARDLKLNGRSITEEIDSQIDDALEEIQGATDDGIQAIQDEVASVSQDFDDAVDLAQRWANEDEDVVVEDGEFSAKHYSIKSSDSANDASTSETNAAGSAASALSQADRAEDEADKAEAAAALAFPLIGMPFPLWDHLPGVEPPDNSGAIKFIRLTAGESGASEYNEGLLTNESVSGSAPLVEATAEIATGPLQGETVHLINTEEAMIRARETSGALQMDQMQKITGRLPAGSGANNFGHTSAAEDSGGVDGAFTLDGDTLYQQRVSGTAETDTRPAKFDSADSPNARVSSTTSGETRSKNVSATYYMRIV